MHTRGKLSTNGRLAVESPATTTRPTQLVNVSEAAQFLAVSPSTLYGWVWQRRIPFVKGCTKNSSSLYALERDLDKCSLPRPLRERGPRAQTTVCQGVLRRVALFLVADVCVSRASQRSTFCFFSAPGAAR